MLRMSRSGERAPRLLLSIIRFAVVLVTGVAVCLSDTVASEFAIRVQAGNHDRSATPVRVDLPDGLQLRGEYRLISPDSGDAVAVQLVADGRAIEFILDQPLAAGAARTYRLEKGISTHGLELIDRDGRQALFRYGGKNILRYNYGTMEPPEGIEPIYARSGYIHPLWSPSGRVVSNDFPLRHKHHHGVWFPWTKTVFEGREVDFWNMGAGKGLVESVGVDRRYSGNVFAGFTARHRFIDLKAPDGPKPALNEVWDVKVYALDRYFVVDFESIQECASDSPLELKQNRYGGFGFRGSGEWEGETGCAFLTSEGKTRLDGHATSARWCAIYGKVDGADCGVTFFGHPENFRAPQRMRLHPKEPFFNFAPCQNGDFKIKPGEPYRSRYRFVVYDGRPEVAEMERLWYDYSEPPVAAVVLSSKQ